MGNVNVSGSFFDRMNQKSAPFLFKHFEHGGRRRLWLKLATLMSNDVPLLTALESMIKLRDSMGQKNHPGAVAIATWSVGIKNGLRLSKVIEGWASDEEVMLISAGEESNSLVDALRSTAEMMAAKTRIVGAVRSGLAYPTVLFALIFAALYVFGYKVIPAFTGAIRSNGWHGMALFMVLTGKFVQAWLWAVILAVVSIIVVFFATLPVFDGRIRIWLDRRAPYSIYRLLYGSSFLTAAAALIGAGVKDLRAIEKLSKGSNPWLRKRLDACAAEMRSGLNMGVALAKTGYEFPDLEVIVDLGVYATVGGFDKALATTGREWLSEAVEMIQARMRIIFAVSIVALATVIGIMVSGMIAMQIQFTELLQQTMH